MLWLFLCRRHVVMAMTPCRSNSLVYCLDLGAIMVPLRLVLRYRRTECTIQASTRSPSSALLPILFWGRVPLLKYTTEKGYPCSNLSTGGPSLGKGEVWLLFCRFEPSHGELGIDSPCGQGQLRHCVPVFGMSHDL